MQLHCFKFALTSLIVMLLSAAPGTLKSSQGESDNAMLLNISVVLDPDLLEDIEVTMLCTSGTPERMTTRITPDADFEWRVQNMSSEQTYCQAYATSPRGFSVSYKSEGDAGSKADENGCQYRDVRSGHQIRCVMMVEQDHVPLTVYKKWIGATGDEGDVAVYLSCENAVRLTTRFVNEGLPATWQLKDIPPTGLVCSVSEEQGDTFVKDESDCQDLIVMPGRGEECTMVNTKVVKRIEMLNRYGKVIMILVMLSAGLIAVRKYV